MPNSPIMPVLGVKRKKIKPAETDNISLARLDEWNRGFFAGVAGQKNDTTQSEAWQQGWSDAQE